MKLTLLFFTLFLQLSFAATQTVAVKDPSNSRLQWMLRWNSQNPSLTGKNVVVAILDTGVDSRVPRLLPGINTAHQNSNTTDTDDHGTPIAGIISQLATSSRILPVKVAQDGAATRKSLLQGLVHALKSGAHVINISLNGDEALLQDALESVGPQVFYRSLIVISSGNWGQPLAKYSREWQNVVVVGATLFDEKPIGAKYSNFGAGVDIMAPAGDVNDGITTFSIRGNLRMFNGTSAAAPVVSGVAALVKEKFPAAGGIQMKQWLLTYSCKFDELKSFAQEGRLVNMAALVGSDPECGHFK